MQLKYRFQIAFCFLLLFISASLNNYVMAQGSWKSLSDLMLGEAIISNGRLAYIASSQTRMRSGNVTGGSVKRTYRYELTGLQSAKVEVFYFSASQKNAIKVNGQNEIALCIEYDSDYKPETERKVGKKLFDITVQTEKNGLMSQNSTPEKNGKEKEESKTKKSQDGIYNAVLIQREQNPLRYLIKIDQNELLEFKANTIWELLVIVPAEYQKPLDSMLSFFNNSNIANLMHRSYNAVVKMPQSDPEKLQQYSQWVKELGSDNYMTRLRATENLIQGGQFCQSYLETLDLSAYDAETQVRLSKLRAKNAETNVPDTVERMSSFFMGKDYAYVPLLQSDNPPFYTEAEKKLRLALGDKFQFDRKSDAETQKSQIQLLKKQLQFPLPAKIDLSKNDLKEKYDEMLSTIMKSNTPIVFFP